MLKTDKKTQFAEYTLSWAVSETNKTVEVPLSGSGLAKDGDALTLYIYDTAAKKNVATNHITWVVKENSAANPLWFGERTKDSYAFGEWTMDLAVATNAVRVKSGTYTIVSLQGSLWCPDCANTDRNFLDVTNSLGQSKFRAWAEGKKIALVTIDIPNFNKASIECDSPTLLRRKAYSTTLARPKEYPGSGADISLTEPAMRSGLGYLTRKGRAKVITDADAAQRLEANRILATANTGKGGFHRPEDRNANRTGVPIFVILRKDGSVLGRFTDFASVSPMAWDQEYFDSYISRFEELMELDADKAEIENNDARTTAEKIYYNGGNVSYNATTRNCFISQADARDTFAIEGASGGIALKVLASGPSAAPVRLLLQQKSDDGTTVSDIATASGNLQPGVSVEADLGSGGGGFYVQIQADSSDAPFFPEYTGGTSLRGYTLTCLAVLKPAEGCSKAQAPALSKDMAIRVVSNVVYRLDGFETESLSRAFEKVSGGDGKLWRCIATGDQTVQALTEGGEVEYQTWVPGTVGFQTVGREVDEGAEGEFTEVSIPVWRDGGVSGSIEVKVVLDTEDPRSVTCDSDGNPRYLPFEPVTVSWKDGESGVTNLSFRIKGDTRHDGYGRFIFKLTKTGGTAKAESVIGHAEFDLLVKEDDEQSAGRVMFTAAEPKFSKALTVYVKEGDDAVLTVTRVGASDGDVAVDVATDCGTAVPSKLSWKNHSTEVDKTVSIKGLEAGQSACVTLVRPENGVVIASAAMQVKVICVSSAAPEFVSAEQETWTAQRYVRFSETAVIDETTLEGGSEAVTNGAVTVSKASGTLPAGLSAVLEVVGGVPGLRLTGVPSKPGHYEPVYQIFETRACGVVKGLTTRFFIDVLDPTAVTQEGGSSEAGAGAVEVLTPVAKTRIFSNIPVIDAESRRLVGSLSATVPATGKVSAKYSCAAGDVAFRSICWSGIDPEDDTLYTTPEPTRDDQIGVYSLSVYAETNGVVRFRIVETPDPALPGRALQAVADGADEPWGLGNTADDFGGTYTVALPVTNIVSDSKGDLAPLGSAFLILRMTTNSSASVSGKMVWAGYLPNGTSVSGSTVLLPGGNAEMRAPMAAWADMPFFVRSSRDEFSGVARIYRRAAELKSFSRRMVITHPDCATYWKHDEAIPGTDVSYAVRMGLHGAIYDPTESLGGCCQESYLTTNMFFFADVALKEPVAIKAGVKVTDNTLVLTQAVAAATLTLQRSTGIVNGGFRFTDTDGKPVAAQWKGVVVVGWGLGCGCDWAEIEPDIGLPFVNGAWYAPETVWYKDELDRDRAVSVRTGGTASVDKE